EMRSIAAPRAPPRRPSVVLFACLFASQAGLLVLSPILPELASEFGVSTAAAGQLRTLSGATGGISAVLLALAPRRPGRCPAAEGHLRRRSGASGGISAVLLALAPRRPGLRTLLSAGAALVIVGSA